MEYRNLGKAGVKVSAIGVGCNQFGGFVDLAGTKAIVQAALEVGINFFDTADVYGNRGGSEEFLGEALAGHWDKVVLATKGRHKIGDGVNDEGASRYHLQNALEGSLRRLKTDHIDLYQIHSWDDTTPIQELMRTLEDFVRAGKVRYLGASNFAAWQLALANEAAELFGWEAFVTVQPEYNMLAREIEKELIPYCRHAHVGILPYFPLAGGFLTGKYKRDETPAADTRGSRSAYVQKRLTAANFDRLDELRNFAEGRGQTMLALAYAWLLAQPQIVSVISGVTKPEQVKVNATATAWKLTAEELVEVRTILEKP